MMKHILTIVILLMSAPVMAQDAQGNLDGYEARLALADQMLAINPPRDQVRAAINSYIKAGMVNAPQLEKDQFRLAMLKIVNHKALEQLSREAYAELFTQAELAAMVEYYSKPEAISAREKIPEFQNRIAPEIIRMLDQAIIRARTSVQ